MTRNPGSERVIRPSRTCSSSLINGSECEMAAMVLWTRCSASLMLIHGAGPRPPRIAATPACTSAGRRPPTGGSHAERGKLFLKCRGLAFRTRGLCRPLEQKLEAMIAFPADIFEDRHDRHSCVPPL